jgi:hypothetical protein
MLKDLYSKLFCYKKHIMNITKQTIKNTILSFKLSLITLQFTMLAITTNLVVIALAEDVKELRDTKIKELNYGTGFFQLVPQTMFGILRTMVNWVFIPVCIAIVVIKLVIIVLAFMGGGNNDDTAKHIKHIFITIFLLGVFLVLGNGNNLISIFLPSK